MPWIKLCKFQVVSNPRSNMRLACFNSFHRFSLFHPTFWLVLKKRKYPVWLTHNTQTKIFPITTFWSSSTTNNFVWTVNGILGPTVPSFSLQLLKIDIKPPVILASLFHGPMTFLTSFWLWYCFEALSEPDLRPLTYNSSSTEVHKSSHEDSDAVVLVASL